MWYSLLSNYTFPTSFVKLHPEEVTALAAGRSSGAEAKAVIQKLKGPMKAFPGNSFVFTDSHAPTDTERFDKKRGAVYSPGSAWRNLAASEKIRKAASEGEVEFICIRPFRRMNRIREFRLFIRGGKLKGMSQYWLVRHFKRLQNAQKHLWKQAQNLVDEISWTVPEDIVIDIYFTSDGDILILDLNPWGPPTSPLLFRNWEQDWDSEQGIRIIPPPVRISGEVNVSF